MTSYVPLKLKDSANLEEFDTTSSIASGDENYLAYQVGLALSEADSSVPSALTLLTDSSSSHFVGIFADTAYDSAVGTGGDGSFLTFSQTATTLRQQDGTVSLTDSDYRIPIYKKNYSSADEMDDITANLSQVNLLRNRTKFDYAEILSVSGDDLTIKIPSERNVTFDRFVGTSINQSDSDVNGYATHAGTVEFGNALHEPPKMTVEVAVGVTTGRYEDSDDAYVINFRNATIGGTSYGSAEAKSEYEVGDNGIYVNALTQKNYQTIINEMDSTALNSLVDRLNRRIFTSDYPGSYKLGTVPPDSSDWTLSLANVMTDTRTDGHSLQYNIYKRTSMAAPNTVLPFSIKRSNGDSGDYQGLQRMTPRQVKYSLGQKAKNRIASDKNTIGSYKIFSATAGTPNDYGYGGTWTAKGTATDTRQAIVDTNYTRTRQSTYARLRSSSYSADYTRTRTSAFSQNYETVRSSSYSADYTKTRTSNYSLGFVGNYIGNYTRTSTRDFTRNFTKSSTYTRTSSRTSTRNFTRLQSYAGNFVGNYARTTTTDGTYFYSNTSPVYHVYVLYIDGDVWEETWTYNGTQVYSEDFETGNPVNPSSGDTRTYNGTTYVRGSLANSNFSSGPISTTEYWYRIATQTSSTTNYTRTSTRNSSRTLSYTGNFEGNFVGNYARTLTSVGNFTGDFLGEYTRDSTRTTPDSFSRDFTGDYSRDFSRTRTSNYNRVRGSTFTGDYIGDYTGDFTGNFTRTSTVSETDPVSPIPSNGFVGDDSLWTYKTESNTAIARVKNVSGMPPSYQNLEVYVDGVRVFGPTGGVGSISTNYYINSTSAGTFRSTSGRDYSFSSGQQLNFSSNLGTSSSTGYTYFRVQLDGTFSNSYTGVYTRNSVQNFTGNYTRERTSTFTGNFTGNYAGAPSGTSYYMRRLGQSGTGPGSGTYSWNITYYGEGQGASETGWYISGFYDSGVLPTTWAFGNQGPYASLSAAQAVESFYFSGYYYWKGTLQLTENNGDNLYYSIGRTTTATNYTRTSTRTVQSYEGNYSRNFAGDYTGEFTRTRTSTYLGGDNYSRDFLGNYTGNYSRNFTRTFEGNYSRDFAGNYQGNYSRDFLGNYARNFLGNYAGDSIDSGSTNIETYTLYVRTA